MSDSVSRQASDRFVEVDGIRLHYNDVGHGPILLCTHGGGPGASAWGGLASAIGELASSFRLLLLDLPNFGQSQQHVTGDGRRPDVFLAALSVAFLDAVGITEPVSYYASSGGAPSALRFGLDFPARTHKLVIQSYAPGMTANPDSVGARATAAFTANPTREEMERLFELFVPKPERRDEAAIEDRLAAATVRGHLESRGEFVALGATGDVAELSALGAEVLFVWGADDRIVPVERVLTALHLIPRARAHIWGDQTGHLVPHDHPAEFARVVSDFLLP